MNFRDDMSQDPPRRKPEGDLRPEPKPESAREPGLEAKPKREAGGEYRGSEDSAETLSGTHPVGTGLGAVGGAAAGAAIGAAGGPLGMAIGGVIGAIAGGAAGHGIAEGVNPSEEDAYWRQQYRREPYHSEDYDYADYEPAFRLGYLDYPTHVGRTYEQAEEELGRDWEGRHRGDSRLTWHQAKPAARAAWHRVASRHFGSRHHGPQDDILERIDEEVGPLAEDDEDDVSIVDDQRGRIH